MYIKPSVSKLFFALFVFFVGISISGCIGTEKTNVLQKSGKDVFPTLIPLENTSNSADQMVEKSPVNENEKPLFWVDPLVKNQFEIIGLSISKSDFVSDKKMANFWFEDKQNTSSVQILTERFFVLTVPFVSETKNIKFTKLEEIWVEINSGMPDLFIWVNPDDVDELSKIFGDKPGDMILISDEKPENCREDNCYRICDFLEVVQFLHEQSLD